MEAVFSYIIGLGAAVMMPIIFTILGVCIGIKFGKALKSGLLVGVGFVGLSVITGLLTDSLGEPLKKVTEIYGLSLGIFDMGWPAAASVAYNTSVGAFIIPVCLAVNIVMLLTKTTKTVNIDLWNYWHFAFIGAVVYFACGNIWWGFFAAIICYIITLIMADLTADKFQKYYDGMDGISIPQPFCQGFVPFAVVINKVLDKIPGFDKLNIDAEGMKKKFGIMGEPLFLGVIVGCAIGALACKDSQELVAGIPGILGLGIKMGAVMELIPRITSLFIEGLKPISDATRELIARKFKNSAGLNIGMSPALVIGHPTTLVVSLLLIPVVLFLSVILPGNQFLPLASLAGMFYLFPAVLPITKAEDLHCRTDSTHRRTLLRDQPGPLLHRGSHRRLCEDPGCRRTHPRRLPGRCARLRFEHLLVGHLPPDVQLQVRRCRHTRALHHGHDVPQPRTYHQSIRKQEQVKKHIII